jgi:hypothetical protein
MHRHPSATEKLVMSSLARSSIRTYSTASRIPPSRNWAPSPLTQLHVTRKNAAKKVEDEDARQPSTSASSSSSEPIPLYISHRLAMRRAFPAGWSPPKKLSREAMDGLRTLHAHDPVQFSTPALAERFKISPEAVRRILKSRWTPSREREAELREREKTEKEKWIRGEREKERFATRTTNGRTIVEDDDGLSLR